jgi:hypothetical protein
MHPACASASPESWPCWRPSSASPWLVEGSSNKDLVQRASALLDHPYNSRQATYDLRRLRRKRLLERIPKSHRYQLTQDGRRVAVLFTKAYGRLLAPGLSVLDPNLPEEIAKCSTLATAWRRLQRALDDFADRSIVAA